MVGLAQAIPQTVVVAEDTLMSAIPQTSTSLKLQNSLAVKITLWFLLLAILSGGLMIVFVRRAVEQTLLSLQLTDAETLQLMSNFDGMAYPQIFASLFILALVGSLGTWTTIQTIRQLTQVVQKIGQGKMDTRVELEDLEGELEVLGTSFNQMADQIQQLVENLEDRVADRVRDLTLTAQISHQITTSLDSSSLLKHISEQTASAFNLYHVSIFLYEEAEQRLILRQGLGERGEAMVARSKSFRLQHDERGIVPQAALKRQAIISNDVISNPDYFPNPLLPETRSEMAVPILFGGILIGILDLQSQEIGRFTNDDIKIMTILADQIAVAIHNAELFDEVRQARELAESADKAKSAFLASTSHELRTPLNAIINLTSFVRKGVMGSLNERQEDTLKMVIQSGQNLLALINDVLDMSKIESGSLKLNIESNIDIIPIIQEACETARTLITDKPVELFVEISESIPPMTLDKHRTRQVLLNVLSNACKFTERGEVRLKTACIAHELHITVSDTGYGIAPEDHEKVFKTFMQTEAGLRQGGGTGLGMPISKSLVEAQGGRISFTSAMGHGTTFTVVLPLT